MNGNNRWFDLLKAGGPVALIAGWFVWWTTTELSRKLDALAVAIDRLAVVVQQLTR